MVWFSDNEAEYKALLQLSGDSDRSAAIVGAAVVENRLERAIKNYLRDDERVTEMLLNYPGPLAAFSAKIHIAHMLGILGNDAYSDMKIVKDIRNDFAHKLEITCFKLTTVADRCRNLRLVDIYVVDSVDAAEGRMEFRQDPAVGPTPPLFRIPQAAEALRQPRERFLYTTKIFVAFLSHVPAARPNRDWL